MNRTQLKKLLKSTLFWRTARRLAKALAQATPLPLCRILMPLPWLGLVFAARFFAHNQGVEYFTGKPGKQIELIPGLSVREPDAVVKARDLLPCEPKARCSILDQCVIHKGAGLSFAGERVAIVAHWDPDRHVDPFVRYYLRHLRQAGFKTILTSAAPVEATEEDMTEADAVVYRKCEGYDFTSWKAALECFASARLATEVVFTNDSVFAPLANIAAVHTVMEKVDCDFWGLLESRDQLPAMPSFYVVFREKALRHECFASFWDNVNTESDKETVVQNFEQSQALWFALNGLIPGAYIHWDMLPGLKGGPAYVYWRQLVECFGVPCLKRVVVNDDVWWGDNSGWQETLRQAGYPLELVQNFMARYRRPSNNN